MKVRELISVLQTLPPAAQELPFITPNVEGGLSEVVGVEVAQERYRKERWHEPGIEPRTDVVVALHAFYGVRSSR